MKITTVELTEVDSPAASMEIWIQASLQNRTTGVKIPDKFFQFQPGEKIVFDFDPYELRFLPHV